MRKKQTIEGQWINTSDWRPLMAFTYDGIVYDNGEPMPAMPVDFAVSLEKQGKVQRLQNGVAVAYNADIGELAPIDYLTGPTHAIFRRIRDRKPSASILRDIYDLAVSQTREPALQEGLLLAIELSE